MTTLFISDLHLDSARPQIMQLFANFIAHEASRAQALYILGDLFEAWIGDDSIDEIGDQVAHILFSLHKQRVPCFFIHGNRDFLLGDAYARRCGMTLLPDPAPIKLDGESVLLMHGDTLCTDDGQYQTFRSTVRTAAWQCQFLQQSLSERRVFADQARRESMSYTRSVANEITDVNDEAVRQVMQDYQVTRLIHGHTHRPKIHRFELNGTPAARIVLGDWYEQGSALRLSQEHYELENI